MIVVNYWLYIISRKMSRQTQKMKIIAKCDNVKNKQNGISNYDMLSAGSLFLLV